MISRERVKIALNHKEADRVPIDFGGLSSTTVMTVAYNKLTSALGLKSNLPKAYGIQDQTAIPERKLIELFHSDVIDIAHAFLKSEDDWREFFIPYNGTTCLIPRYLDELVDIEMNNEQTILLKHKDGTILAKMSKSACTMEQTFWPYKDLPKMPEIIKDEEFWKFMGEIPYVGKHLDVFDKDQENILKNGIKELFETTEYAMLFIAGGTIFDPGFLTRGFDNFFCDVYKDSKGVKKFISYLVEYYLRYIEKIIDIVSDYVEAIHFYDDLGHQGGPFISPEQYREFWKPGHKKMWDYVHSNSNCKVSLHSCGSIYKLLPDLIDAGLDILNPVQTSARDMEPKRLKKEFGKDLVFWGGGCEPHTLSIKTPEEVKEEVKERIDIFGKGGGYVFAPIHNITSEVKPENIIAMYEAAYKYGVY